MIDRLFAMTPNEWPPYVAPLLLILGAVVLAFTIWLQSTLVHAVDRVPEWWAKRKAGMAAHGQGSQRVTSEVKTQTREEGARSMTFRRRLAMFASLAWVGFVFTSYTLDEYGEFPWEWFLVQGILPVAAFWGVGWLIAGWRAERHR